MIHIPLPWQSPPADANRSLRSVAPHARAAAVRQIKSEAGWAIRAAKPTPVVAANVTLHYRPKDRRRRDADGLFPVLKAVTDALVDCGVIPEDSWVTVPRAACEIHPPSDEGPAMWLELTPPDGEEFQAWGGAL